MIIAEKKESGWRRREDEVSERAASPVGEDFRGAWIEVAVELCEVGIVWYTL